MPVLMIGLDGATFHLLDRFVADGTMPNLGALMRRGARATLTSTWNPLTPPAWTTMVTGRSPEAHGIYDFLRPHTLEDGNVFLHVNDSRRIQTETIWSMANRAGRRATALNFFGHAPAPEVDGYVVSGFVPWKHLRQATQPPGLFDQIKASETIDFKKLGMNIAEEKKCIQGLDEGENMEWIALQEERDTAWTDLTCWLLENDPTPLAAVVLDGPDKVQHLFWPYLDPAYAPEQPDAAWQEVHDRCLAYYRKLDDNIAKLVGAAGDGTDVAITSDHGFGPTTEIVYLNEWLAQRGYLTWADTAQADGGNQLTAARMKDQLGMIDWPRTNAFCPSPSSNAIYLKPRTDGGAGIRDEDYAETCLSLRQELLAWRHPVDGEPVFTDVRTNKLLGRSFVEPCPDLTVRLRDGGFVSILPSNEIVRPRGEVNGTHRPHGVFIGCGPSFRQGNAAEALSILDVAPLLLTLADVPVPRDLEGRVPSAVLASGVAADMGAATAAPASTTSGDDDVPSDEEREAIMNQMRLLGYMD